MDQRSAQGRSADVIALQASLLPPEERHAFLDSACGGDSKLRARVERLLPYADTDLFQAASTGPFLPKGQMAGKYIIGDMIGIGGMSVVVEAQDTVLNRTVAIKQFFTKNSDETVAAQRFLGEVRILARFHHPNIVTIHDAIESGDSFYLVMELLDGDDLATLIARGCFSSPAERLDIAIQLAEALKYSHDRGVIHQDVKPGNVMREREGGRVKLMDFGIARHVQDLSGAAGGTRAYMAPEQMAAEGPAPTMDVYSYGLVLFELFAGLRPDHGANPLTPKAARRKLAALRLPGSLIDMVTSSIEISPEQRPKDFAQILAKLMTVREELRRPESPATEPSVSTAPTPTRPTRVALLAASLFFLVLLGLYMSFNGKVEGSARRQPASTATPAPVPQPQVEAAERPPAKAAEVPGQTSNANAPSVPKSGMPAVPPKSGTSEVAPPRSAAILQADPAPAPAVSLPQPPVPEQVPAPPQTPVSVPEPDSESADWARLGDSRNADAVFAFILKYPNGKRAPEASRLLQRLEWDRIRNAIDPLVFEQYAARFPGGEFSAEALAQTRQLRAKVEESRIREVLGAYVSAYNSRDTEGIRRVWVSLSDGDLDQYRQTFRARTLSLRLDCSTSPSFAAGAWPPAAAVTQCHRLLDMTPNEGRKPELVDDPVTVRLQREGVEWKIFSLTGGQRRGN